MQLVMVSGGKGTRLRSRLGDLPKSLAPVGARPVIEHQIELARRHGFDDIVLLLGYGGDKVEALVKDGSQYGVRARACFARTPLGSAGSVLAAIGGLDDRFLILYGDVMLNVDLGRFWRFHLHCGAAASLFVHPNAHPLDSDLIEVDRTDRIKAFHPYPHAPGKTFTNLANAGLYAMERDTLATFVTSRPVPDFGKDLFPDLLGRGFALFGYRSPEYIHDIGTPERLDRANRDYSSGRIAAGSLETAAPALFVRDDCILDPRHRTNGADQRHLVGGAAEAIRRLNDAGWRVVAFCGKTEVQSDTKGMETALGVEGAYADRIYSGADEDQYASMIEAAHRDLNVDTGRSWIIEQSSGGARARPLPDSAFRLPAAPPLLFGCFSDVVRGVLAQAMEGSAH